MASIMEENKMDIIVILILGLFLVTTVAEGIHLKDLVIPTRKRRGEIVFLIIASIGILGVTYFYAKGWTQYTLGILGTIMLILSLLKTGITSKGVSYIPTGNLIGFIPWNKIKSLTIYLKKDVEVHFSGQILYFNKDDYDKIIKISKENLSSESIIIK